MVFRSICLLMSLENCWLFSMCGQEWNQPWPPPSLQSPCFESGPLGSSANRGLQRLSDHRDEKFTWHGKLDFPTSGANNSLNKHLKWCLHYLTWLRWLLHVISHFFLVIVLITWLFPKLISLIISLLTGYQLRRCSLSHLLLFIICEF